ncbi:chromosome partitioning protein, partial [Lasius niger]
FANYQKWVSIDRLKPAFLPVDSVLPKFRTTEEQHPVAFPNSEVPCKSDAEVSCKSSVDQSKVPESNTSTTKSYTTRSGRKVRFRL